jgi:hypothetical protein
VGALLGRREAPVRRAVSPQLQVIPMTKYPANGVGRPRSMFP